MKFRATTEYAIRTLIFIAKNKDGRTHSAKSLNKALGIPYKYLARILTKLAKAKFLTVSLGKNGGYLIKRPLMEIRFIDVLNEFEETPLFERCIIGDPNCSIAEPCDVHKHWVPIRNTLKMKFSRLTLKDIVKK